MRLGPDIMKSEKTENLLPAEQQALDVNDMRPRRWGWLILLLGFGGFFLWASLAPLDQGVAANGMVRVPVRGASGIPRSARTRSGPAHAIAGPDRNAENADLSGAGSDCGDGVQVGAPNRDSGGVHRHLRLRRRAQREPRTIPDRPGAVAGRAG